MSETLFHLFVYGTLSRAGEATEELLGDCERVGSATVEGTLYDTGAYPALVLGGAGRVEGEIWRCPAPVLPRLDRYEGVEEGLFRRIARRVRGHACWLYVAGPRLGPRLTSADRIPSGRWLG